MDYDLASEPATPRSALAAEAAAELVSDGMLVGLGTGSTVAHPAARARRAQARDPLRLDLGRDRGSGALSWASRSRPFDRLERLDIAIDGADQIAPDGWLVKGGGGAHTREKIVAAAADRFVVIADSSKPVEEIVAADPARAARLRAGGDPARARRRRAPRRTPAPSPDGGVIADYRGEVGDPILLAARLSATPGVVDHGLFPPALVADVLVGPRRRGRAHDGSSRSPRR